MQTNKTKPAITNVKELRNDLIEAYTMLRDDPRRINQVAELSNTAGKIIASVKVELEYAILRCEKPNIDFIGDASIREVLDMVNDAKKIPSST